MPSFTYRGTVAASPQAVFIVLANPGRTADLFAGAAADVVIDGGPVRAGTRLRRSRTVGSTSATADATVEVHRPGKELAIVGEARGFRVETRWRLRPGADASCTEVEYECKVEGSGLASLVAGAVSDALQRADADHLDRLRRIVEGPRGE